MKVRKINPKNWEFTEEITSGAKVYQKINQDKGKFEIIIIYDELVRLFVGFESVEQLDNPYKYARKILVRKTKIFKG